MCHAALLSPREPWLGNDLLYFHASEILPVPDRALVLFLTLEFEDNDLVTAPVLSDAAPHTRRFQPLAERKLVRIVRNCEHTVKFHAGTNFTGQLFHFNCLTWRDAVLLAAGLNYCVHDKPFS